MPVNLPEALLSVLWDQDFHQILLPNEIKKGGPDIPFSQQWIQLSSHWMSFCPQQLKSFPPYLHDIETGPRIPVAAASHTVCYEILNDSMKWCQILNVTSFVDLMEQHKYFFSPLSSNRLSLEEDSAANIKFWLDEYVANWCVIILFAVTLAKLISDKCSKSLNLIPSIIRPLIRKRYLELKISTELL